MTGAIDRLLAALDQHGRTYRQDKPNHWMAQCPVPTHGKKRGDRNRSLSITAEDGKVLFDCLAKCNREDVRAELGLTWAEFSDEPISETRGNGHRFRSTPKLPPPPPEPELQCGGKHPEHGWPSIGKPDKPAVGETWFPREWERGFPIAWKVRRTCVRCSERTFQWRQPNDRGGTKSGKPDGVMPLAGLPDLLDAIESGKPVHVYATEGDSDADAVRKAGVIAVTAGGVNDWKPEHLDQFDGVDRVTFCSDADEAGRGLARRIHGWLKERGVTHRVVEPIKGKDVREHLGAGHSLIDLVPWPPDQPQSPERNQQPEEPQDYADKRTGRFTVRTFAEIQRRTSTWLLDGVLPDDDLTVFIGEEGIGKGLFSADAIARVTGAGHNVLIIATEDDFERVLGPRLDVAGAPTPCKASRTFHTTCPKSRQ
jgi:hypothetical protein